MSLKRDVREKQAGWVTTELAFAALGIGVAVVLCAGILSVCLAQIRCHDAAAEIARQGARDDLAAVQEIESRLPPTATVEISQQGDQVVVSVSLEVRPWGQWLPALTVHSDASVVHEGRGT